MPIKINSFEFEDEWGNVTPFYRSNAGDKTTMRIDVSSIISASSVGNPFIIDTISGVITSGFNFEQEGFRAGQILQAYKLNSAGIPISSYLTGVVYCNGNEIKLSITQVPDTANQEAMAFIVGTTNRQSIDCAINHISNLASNGIDSLIDGEATRFKFSSIHTMSIGASQVGALVGNQSGQYLNGATITRLADPALYTTKYTISIELLNSGIINSEWFDSSDCLKILFQQLWSTIDQEPYGQTELLFNKNANTGHYDQAHNTDVINSTLLQGITEIDYAVPTPFTIIVDGPTTNLGIGASYISINDSYYKNKPLQQGRYGMVRYTSNIAVGSFPSLTNPSGAGYEIQITSFSSVGTVTTINGNFIPNTQFTAFMDSVEEGDRAFYIWVKCGNINHKVFDSQLTMSPPVGGELIMNVSKAFSDHAWNFDTFGSVNSWKVFDTEDDVSYYGTFRMDKGGVYSSFRVRIEGYNLVTQEDFTLLESVISLSSVQIDNDGVYLIDESLTINPELPTTSVKRNAYLRRQPTIDTSTEFGVQIYYPFILNWKYWLPQLNANVDFYPNQDKNWQRYSQFGDWDLRIELELIKDGLAYTHTDAIFVNDYNASPQISSSIEFVRVLDNSIIPAPIDGEITMVRSRHTNLLGGWGLNTWGMITCEPKENSPRWISSTVIDYDNNGSNPLYPLAGFTSAKLTIAGNLAIIECLFDSSKINASEVSFTAKIKNPDKELPPFFKTTAPNDINKTTSPDDILKTMA